MLEKALEIAAWVISTGVQFDDTTYEELMSTAEIASMWDKKAISGIQQKPFSRESEPDASAASAAVDEGMLMGMVSGWWGKAREDGASRPGSAVM